MSDHVAQVRPAGGAEHDGRHAITRLFIIGCPRSGTTWMGMLLAQHPEIAVCQQLGVMSAINAYKKWWAAGESTSQSRYLSSIIRFAAEDAAPQFEQLMSADQMRAVCRSLADSTYGYATASKPECRVVVDKTPENVRHPDAVLEMFPDAHILHLIRDPRSVFVSHRRGSKDFGALFPTDPAGSATYWTNDVRRGRRAGELTKNYREVRYESMKSDGASELEAILKSLGVSADPVWCKSVVEKTSIEMLQGTKGSPKNFFRSGEAAGWRDELTSHQLHAVEFYARDLMLELGYEPEHPRSAHKPAGMVVRDTVEHLLTGMRKATR